MKLQKREQVLAATTGGLLLVFLLWKVGPAAWGMFASESPELEPLRTKIEEKQKQLDDLEAARGRLKEWRDRSLPADPQAAQALYHDWLLKTAEKQGLRDRKMSVPPVQGAKGTYQSVQFNLQCKGSLASLTGFLYDFYSAGHLQRIKRLSIKPLEKSSDLELTIGVEGLIVPGVTRRDKPTELAGNRLGQADLASYRKTIVERNIFGPYKPPPPPVVKREEKPPEPKKVEVFDKSKLAFVDSIVRPADDPRRQVWINIRPEGKTLRLREGDEFSIGPLKGTIARIDARQIEIEVDGKSRTVRQGEPLTGEPAPAADRSTSTAPRGVL